MRSGQMDCQIELRRAGTPVIDDDGVPQQTWSTIATLRAHVIQSSTEEYMRSFGVSDETATIFRTRYVEGLTNADELTFDGDTYQIKEFKEIGRRKGLEIRTVSYAAVSS